MNTIKVIIAVLVFTVSNAWAAENVPVDITVPGRDKPVVISAVRVSDLVSELTARFKTMTEVEFYTYTGKSLGLFSGIPQDLSKNGTAKPCSVPITVIGSNFPGNRAFSSSYCGEVMADVINAEKHAEEELQLMVISAVAETGSPASVSFFIPAIPSRIIMTALPVGPLDEQNCRVVSSGYIVETETIRSEVNGTQFDTICLEQKKEVAQAEAEDSADSFWSFSWLTE